MRGAWMLLLTLGACAHGPASSAETDEPQHASRDLGPPEPVPERPPLREALDFGSLPPSAAWALSEEVSTRKPATEHATLSTPFGGRDDEPTDASEGRETPDDDGDERSDDADVPDAGPYTIAIARPFPEGTRFTIRHRTEANAQMEMDVPDLGRQSSQRREEIVLHAEAEVVSSDADGLRALELDIRKLQRTSDGKTKQVVPSGRRIDVRWTADGELELEDGAPAVLRTALPLDIGGSPAMAPQAPQQVGADWQVPEAAIRRALRGKGARFGSGGSASLQGRLAGRTELGDHTAVRVAFDGQLRDVEPADLPAEADFRSSDLDYHVEVVVPADPSVAVVQRNEGSVQGELHIVVNTGSSDAEMHISVQESRQTEYTLP